MGNDGDTESKRRRNYSHALVGIRVGSLLLALVVAQALILGAPGNPPIANFQTTFVAAAPDGGDAEIVAAVGYASRTTATASALIRDSVAYAVAAHDLQTYEPFTKLVLTKSPRLRATPISHQYRLVPPTNYPGIFVSPTALAVGELNRLAAGQTRASSEELVVGYSLNSGANYSALLILRDFDAARPLASELSNLSGASTLRFNCESPTTTGVCSQPPSADPVSSVAALGTGDYNGDSRVDIAVLADDTYDANRPSDTTLGLRLFICLNTTPVGVEIPTFNCRGQGWESITPSDFDPPPGTVFTKNSMGGSQRWANTISIAPQPGITGDYRAIISRGNTISEITANLNSRRVLGVVTTAYPSPVKFAQYAELSGDSHSERLVMLQPTNDPADRNWEPFVGPIVEGSPKLSDGESALDLVARVQRCDGRAAGGYSVCTMLPIARGAILGGSLGYELRDAAPILGIAPVSPSAVRNRIVQPLVQEIVVASTGAGRGINALQSLYELREVSVMSLGGDVFNLPRSSSVIASGTPAPSLVGGALGTFWPDTSGVTRLSDVAVVTKAGDVLFARNGSPVMKASVLGKLVVTGGATGDVVKGSDVGGDGSVTGKVTISPR
jgi:hypothetical protein